MAYVPKDGLWAMADEMPWESSIPFANGDEDYLHIYQTLFEDHREGEIVATPRSVLRMRIERMGVPWSDL